MSKLDGLPLLAIAAIEVNFMQGQQLRFKPTPQHECDCLVTGVCDALTLAGKTDGVVASCGLLTWWPRQVARANGDANNSA